MGRRRRTSTAPAAKSSSDAVALLQAAGHADDKPAALGARSRSRRWPTSRQWPSKPVNMGLRGRRGARFNQHSRQRRHQPHGKWDRAYRCSEAFASICGSRRHAQEGAESPRQHRSAAGGRVGELPIVSGEFLLPRAVGYTESIAMQAESVISSEHAEGNGPPAYGYQDIHRCSAGQWPHIEAAACRVDVACGWPIVFMACVV